MGRPRKEPNEKLVEIPCRVPPDIEAQIHQICANLDRPTSYIARKLIIKGLLAYLEDGELEPKKHASTLTADAFPSLIGKKVSPPKKK